MRGTVDGFQGAGVDFARGAEPSYRAVPTRRTVPSGGLVPFHLFVEDRTHPVSASHALSCTRADVQLSARETLVTAAFLTPDSIGREGGS